jgi:hypothetical protein
MQRPPLPRRPRHRNTALARAAGAAGVAFLLCALPACKGGDASEAAVAPSANAVAEAPARTASPPRPALVVAPVPPPPDLAKMASEPASGAAPDDALGAIHARLDAMLAQAAQCSTSSECRSVAVGGKACGGPTGYRAYSTRGADPAAVEALAKQEHELAMAAERAAHRVSNCMMLADPGAKCEANRCVTGGPMAGPNPATR